VNDKLPSQYVKDLLAAGYGKMETYPPTREGGPTVGTFFLSFREMEAMGEAERLRLGVEPSYQFALSHRPPPTSTPTDASLHGLHGMDEVEP